MDYLQGQNGKRLALAGVALLMGVGLWLSRGLGSTQIWLYGLGMFGLVGIGVESFLGGGMDGESRRDAFGITPWLVSLLLVSSGLWLAQAVPAEWLIQECLAGAVLSGAMLFSLDVAASPGSSLGRYGRIAANTIFFVLAFILFVLIYQTKQRASITAPAIGLVAFVTCLELLRSDAERRLDRTTLILSGIAALVMAEATWLLNYWPVGGLVGGSLLLLCLYVLVGLLQCIRDGSLRRNLVLEYGAVGVIGFLAIIVIVP